MYSIKSKIFQNNIVKKLYSESHKLKYKYDKGNCEKKLIFVHSIKINDPTLIHKIESIRSLNYFIKKG